MRASEILKKYGAKHEFYKVTSVDLLLRENKAELKAKNELIVELLAGVKGAVYFMDDSGWISKVARSAGEAKVNSLKKLIKRAEDENKK